MIKINGKEKKNNVRVGDLVRHYDDNYVGIVIQESLSLNNIAENYNVIEFDTDDNTIIPRYREGITLEEIEESYEVLSNKENTINTIGVNINTPLKE